MWILPTNSPTKVSNFFRSCRDMSIGTPGIVLVNRADYEVNKAEYDKVLAPSSWKFIKTVASGFVAQVQEAWKIYRDDEWIGILGDDCLALSLNWDEHLVKSLNGANIVSPQDDSIQRTEIGRGSVWSGELVRSVGHLFFPDIDSEIDQYAAWSWLAESTASHLKKGEIVIRRTESKSDPQPSGYLPTWQLRYGNDLIKHIEDFKTSKGVLRFNIDFTGTSVMIAVPTVTGSLDYEFLICVHETFALYAQHGVAHEFVIEPFNADLVMARSKLFARFMRSNCSHLLMLDADMGWDSTAICRLHAAKKDFVAVAGPKKKVPLACAVTPIPIDETRGKIHFVRESGTVEVSEVGAAFCLISREMGEKMIAAYPELTYVGMGGIKEHALFLPMIVNGHYKAEDYAFCKRWRDIGGQIHVCPDISIKHVGRKVFEGAWSQTWQAQDKPLGA